MGITRVTKKGQVTIPADVRRKLGISEKDRLEIVAEGDRAVVRKLARASELRGSIPVGKELKGKSWKEIERETGTRRGRGGK